MTLSLLIIFAIFTTIHGQSRDFCPWKYPPPIANGQSFNEGCMSRCTCQNGTVGCVDLCPPAGHPGPRCQDVHVPGQCCPKVACDKELTTCQKFNVTQTSRSIPMERFPWTLVYCKDYERKPYFGGIILTSRHVLTYATNITNSTPLQFRTKGESFHIGNDVVFSIEPFQVSKVLSHPNDSAEVAKGNAALQIIELAQGIPETLKTQRANLPLDADHCKSLVETEKCPFDIVGFGAGPYRGLIVHLLSSAKNADICPLSSGAVVVSTQQAEYVVGVTQTTTPTTLCDPQVNVPLLSLCDYMDWIKTSIKS